MTPSTPKLRHGWSDNSIAISGVSDLSRNGYLFEYARKSDIYRPAYIYRRIVCKLYIKNNKCYHPIVCIQPSKINLPDINIHMNSCLYKKNADNWDATEW